MEQTIDQAKLDRITEQILKQIDNGNGFSQEGAFNLRHNGVALCHGDSEHIKIRKKEDKPGIDVYIDAETKGEQVHRARGETIDEVLRGGVDVLSIGQGDPIPGGAPGLTTFVSCASEGLWLQKHSQSRLELLSMPQ